MQQLVQQQPAWRPAAGLPSELQPRLVFTRDGPAYPPFSSSSPAAYSSTDPLGASSSSLSSSFASVPVVPFDVRSEHVSLSASRRRAVSLSLASVRRGVVMELPHPLWQDRTLDQHSSRQYRPREEDGRVFTRHLHPPLRTATTAASASAPSSASSTFRTHAPLSVSRASSSRPSPKRYHPVSKAPLPPLNAATYQRYLATTQPLLNPTIAGRKMCKVNQWRENLLRRKVDVYDKAVHA